MRRSRGLGDVYKRQYDSRGFTQVGERTIAVNEDRDLECMLYVRRLGTPQA